MSMRVRVWKLFHELGEATTDGEKEGIIMEFVKEKVRLVRKYATDKDEINEK